jgi:hypothetical protein
VKIYLDDNIRDQSLIAFLTNDGHDVFLPHESDKGNHDARHFLAALLDGRAILTRNYWDFDALHDLVVGAKGQHAGVLEVRSDNNRKRDMSNKQIAATVTKLEKLGVEVVNQLVILNDWR